MKKNDFRIIRTTNLKLVRALDSELWDDCYWDTFEGHEVWIAKARSGKVVGYASLQMVDRGTSGFLTKAGVLPEARGNGLQKRLIRVRERRARELGAKTTITYTADWNVASMNSLISCGYKTYRPAYDWGLPFADGGIYWKKKLL